MSAAERLKEIEETRKKGIDLNVWQKSNVSKRGKRRSKQKKKRKNLEAQIRNEVLRDEEKRLFQEEKRIKEAVMSAAERLKEIEETRKKGIEFELLSGIERKRGEEEYARNEQ